MAIAALGAVAFFSLTPISKSDGKYSNQGDFAEQGNNQMLCADPKTGELRRF